MSVVLDASVTLALLFGDETTQAVREVFDGVAEHGAVVPGLWWLEIANSLTTAVRRKRVPKDFRDAALHDLTILDLTTDPLTIAQAWTATLALADRHRLTVYDAAYLELAARRGLPLATLDRDLRDAAINQNVSLAVSAS